MGNRTKRRSKIRRCITPVAQAGVGAVGCGVTVRLMGGAFQFVDVKGAVKRSYIDWTLQPFKVGALTEENVRESQWRMRQWRMEFEGGKEHEKQDSPGRSKDALSLHKLEDLTDQHLINGGYPTDIGLTIDNTLNDLRDSYRYFERDVKLAAGVVGLICFLVFAGYTAKNVRKLYRILDDKDVDDYKFASRLAKVKRKGL